MPREDKHDNPAVVEVSDSTGCEPSWVGLRKDAWRVATTAGPLYMSMLAASLSAIVNTVVLGHVGTVPLAAFALTGVVYFPAVTAVTGAVRGVMPFVTPAMQDNTALRRIIGDGTWLALAVGVVGALGVAAVPVLGQVMGVPQATVDALGSFHWLMACVVMISSLGAMSSSSLVGMERSHVVMRSGLVGALVTIGLSPLLGLGPGALPALGLEGVGAALLLASTCVLAINLLWLRKLASFSITSALLRGGSLSRTLELARVGLPMAGTVLVKFSVLGVLALAAVRISPDAAASHSVATSVVGIVFAVAVAVGKAGIPLVSSRASHNDVSGVRRAVLAGVAVSGTIVCAVCVLMMLLNDAIVSSFTTDAAVIAQTHTILPLVAMAIMADGLQAVFGFGLTGLKRSSASFVVFSIIYGALAIVAIPIADVFGLTGLWATLASINVLLVCGQATAFWHISGRLTRR